MILQLDKVLKSEVGENKGPAVLRHDIIDGVTKIREADLGFTAHFENGETANYAKGCLTGLYEEEPEYTCLAAWLLNNNGKTLKQLF